MRKKDKKFWIPTSYMFTRILPDDRKQTTPILQIDIILENKIKETKKLKLTNR